MSPLGSPTVDVSAPLLTVLLISRRVSVFICWRMSRISFHFFFGLVAIEQLRCLLNRSSLKRQDNTEYRRVVKIKVVQSVYAGNRWRRGESAPSDHGTISPIRS